MSLLAFTGGTAVPVSEQLAHCPEPPVTPFTNPVASTGGWLPAYAASIDEARQWHRLRPSMQHFELLRTMADTPELSFQSWVPDYEGRGGGHYQDIVLDNPVLFVMWKSEDTGDITHPWVDARQLQQFISYDAALAGGSPVTSGNPLADTQWAVKHRNTQQLMNASGLDRGCFNLNINPNACDEALFWGLPSVGMPYEFLIDQSDLSNPYPDLPVAWWKSYMVIAVADRSAFVRPSYNPTVIPAQEEPLARSGRPLWDAKLQRYRRARPWEPEWEVQQQALENFSAWNVDGTYTENFAEWLSGWRESSWQISSPVPEDQRPAQTQFPYTCMGLTINWLASAEGPLPKQLRSLSLSEFIIKGKSPIYIIGTRSGAQYYAQPMDWQVSWCDSCPGDLDMNGKIGVGDVFMLLERWGQTCTCLNNLNDNNVDARVSFDELLWMLQNWGDCEGWPDELPRPLDCD